MSKHGEVYLSRDEMILQVRGLDQQPQNYLKNC